jgi:dolichol-phosphate mannosyltransferase
MQRSGFSPICGHVSVAHASAESGASRIGRAITYDLEHTTGDAIVVMMADESDDCQDVVHY